MKFNKISVIVTLIVVILIVSLLLFSTFREPRTVELGDLTFEELCNKNRDQWMEMKETRKGKMLSGGMCFGCMIADNHFCDANDYVEYVKKLPDFIR